MIQRTLSTLVLSILVMGVFGAIVVAQTAIGRMAKEDLKARLDDPKVIVVDVRTHRDWSTSDLKIKGAARVDVSDVASVVETYGKAKTLVFYCA